LTSLAIITFSRLQPTNLVSTLNTCFAYATLLAQKTYLLLLTQEQVCDLCCVLTGGALDR